MIMKSTHTAVKLANRATSARATTAAQTSPSPKPPKKTAEAAPIETSSMLSKTVKRRSPPVVTVTPPAPTANKQARLIALLRSPKGATIEQMTKLTGWQAHTVRGTISGALRKRLGLNVLSAAPPDSKSRIYRIVESVTA
jgi:hypothetical protein